MSHLVIRVRLTRSMPPLSHLTGSCVGSAAARIFREVAGREAAAGPRLRSARMVQDTARDEVESVALDVDDQWSRQGHERVAWHHL